MRSYHRPPDDYEPPTQCEQCHEVIGYFPVIGGRKWTHIGPADHEVVMRPEGWWDVVTGTTCYGITDWALAKTLERTDG